MSNNLSNRTEWVEGGIERERTLDICHTVLSRVHGPATRIVPSPPTCPLTRNRLTPRIKRRLMCPGGLNDDSACAFNRDYTRPTTLNYSTSDCSVQRQSIDSTSVVVLKGLFFIAQNRISRTRQDRVFFRVYLRKFSSKQLKMCRKEPWNFKTNSIISYYFYCFMVMSVKFFLFSIDGRKTEICIL